MVVQWSTGSGKRVVRRELDQPWAENFGGFPDGLPRHGQSGTPDVVKPAVLGRSKGPARGPVVGGGPVRKKTRGLKGKKEITTGGALSTLRAREEASQSGNIPEHWAAQMALFHIRQCQPVRVARLTKV